MKLHNLRQLKGAHRRSKRIGRGYGCGKGGHTVGRGTKGQKARSRVRIGFEGGQNPLYKSLPQARGFKAADNNTVKVVNVSEIEKVVKAKSIVDRELLEKVDLIKSTDKYIKVLGTGEIKKSVTIKGIRVSGSAKDKIEKAGGKVL